MYLKFFEFTRESVSKQRKKSLRLNSKNEQKKFIQHFQHEQGWKPILILFESTAKLVPSRNNTLESFKQATRDENILLYQTTNKDIFLHLMR